MFIKILTETKLYAWIYFHRKCFCFHEIVIYKQHAYSITDALISAKVTSKKIETHLKYELPFSAMLHT